MTQDQHRRPLAPGEIRSYVVGDRAFRVMHVAGGSFTQVTARDGIDGATRVLATCRFGDAAVRAYAEAIEQAESDAIERTHAEARVENLVRSRRTGQFANYGDQAFGDAVRRMCSAFGLDAAPYLAMLDAPDPMDDENLPLGASRTLVTGGADWQALYTLGGE